MSNSVSSFPTPPRPPASSPLQSYLDLDLAPDSAAAADLMSRAEREATRASLSLTGDGDAGAASANLTPEMSAWLGGHVMGKRQAALSDFEARARQIKLGGNRSGIVQEIEEDRHRRDHNVRCAEIRKRFYERHRSSIDSLNRLQHEYDAIRAEEGDRDAVVPSRLVEFGLPLLVAVPEGFMNYASFVALTGLGVAGLGLTVVVGAGIGLSAWFAGRLWKGWRHYMRADDEDQQQSGRRMLWIASTVLTVALVVVGYARYRTVAEKAMREIILGLAPSNPVTSTLLLLAGNLLVFFVGAAITYAIHDENPAFADKALALSRARAAHDAVRRRELDAKISEADRGHRQNLGDMNKLASNMARQSDYAPVAEDMGRLRAKDGEVVGLLQSYRGQLAGLIERRDPDFRFNVSAAERLSGHGSGAVGLSEFTAQDLHLYRGVR